MQLTITAYILRLPRTRCTVAHTNLSTLIKNAEASVFFVKRNELQLILERLNDEKNKIKVKLADFQGDVSSQDQAYEDLKVKIEDDESVESFTLVPMVINSKVETGDKKFTEEIEKDEAHFKKKLVSKF